MRWPLARIDSDNSHVEVELYQNIDYFENSIHSSAYSMYEYEKQFDGLSFRENSNGM